VVRAATRHPDQGLTTIKPAGKAAQAATGTLHGEAGRLSLSIGDGTAVGLDTDTRKAARRPSPHNRNRTSSR
jgi:hypothetical protein